MEISESAKISPEESGIENSNFQKPPQSGKIQKKTSVIGVGDSNPPTLGSRVLHLTNEPKLLLTFLYLGLIRMQLEILNGLRKMGANMTAHSIAVCID